jgi:transcriptional regulator with XRE-family HTH domain
MISGILVNRWVRGGVHPSAESRHLMAEFGRELRAARRRAGLTQAQLAERLEFSQAYVSRVEGGRCNLTISAMGAFARALGCTLTFANVFTSPEDRLDGTKDA